ncbi:hypothetical protein DFS34DRAFT_601402 [Phlyctochytrium arcticum]|nr:hypothetical protein DFS34DRAFT_601402 [Phlyctochytrium arcticum]
MQAGYGGEPVYASKRRRVCCCFHSRRACCGTFLFIFLVLAGLLGFLIWYFFPHVPEYGHSDPYQPASAEGFDRLAPTSQWKPGPVIPTAFDPLTVLSSNLAFSYGMGIDVWINNNVNRFDIDIGDLNVLGRLQDGSGANPPKYIDTNNFKLQVNMVNVNFPKGQNTTIKVPLDLRYNATFSSIIGQTDPFLQLLSDSCNISFLNLAPKTGGQAKPLVMEFDANFAPKPTRVFGQSIDKTVGPFSLACPDQLKSSLTQLDTLAKGVLNGAFPKIP